MSVSLKFHHVYKYQRRRRRAAFPGSVRARAVTPLPAEPIRGLGSHGRASEAKALRQKRPCSPIVLQYPNTVTANHICTRIVPGNRRLISPPPCPFIPSIEKDARRKTPKRHQAAVVLSYPARPPLTPLAITPLSRSRSLSLIPSLSPVPTTPGQQSEHFAFAPPPINEAR